MLFSCDEYAVHEQDGDNCESIRSPVANQTKDDAQRCKRASDSTSVGESSRGPTQHRF